MVAKSLSGPKLRRRKFLGCSNKYRSCSAVNYQEAKDGAGNVVVQIDETEYQKDFIDLQFNIIRRIALQNRESLPTTMEMHRKLSSFLQINNLKLIALVKGCYHVLLQAMSDRSTTMSKGPVNLKPCIFRVVRWSLGFNPPNQVISTTQVWIRLASSD